MPDSAISKITILSRFTFNLITVWYADGFSTERKHFSELTKAEKQFMKANKAVESVGVNTIWTEYR